MTGADRRIRAPDSLLPREQPGRVLLPGRAASHVEPADLPAVPDPPCSVVGIGELLWDLLPDGPRLGGAPFNVVAHLTKFGCRTSYVSAVGRDELGQRAMTDVARLGVATTLIQVSGMPTGVVRVELDSPE